MNKRSTTRRPSILSWAGISLLLACRVMAGSGTNSVEARHVSAWPDLSSVPQDLITPETVGDQPAAGRRVRQTLPGYESTEVHHTLYLPVNWQPNHLYPVIVEYAGNGRYQSQYGDRSDGTVEGSNLGYGISGGSNYIWICMPFVQIKDSHKQNAIQWWGDVAESIAYCTNTVRYVCQHFGGDTNAVILAGFSRGAIACNYIGLHDDGIASLWRAFIPYSHYDGALTNWPYSDADRAAARVRLVRLRGRPQFICQENSTEVTKKYLAGTRVVAPFTFVTVPFRNHSDTWTLRDNAARRAVRQWLNNLGLP